MFSEHTSHQIGLDVDIWFAPMPDHVQSREEREFGPGTDVVAPTCETLIRNSGPRSKPRPVLTLAKLPPACKQIVKAP